jgi:hypothetical protein
VGDESIFTDAARYIEIVQIIKEKGHKTLPSSDEILGLKVGWNPVQNPSILKLGFRSFSPDHWPSKNTNEGRRLHRLPFFVCLHQYIHFLFKVW